MKRTWTHSLVAGVLALGLVPSCANEREPINRVQSDALAKSFFVGKLDDPNDDPEFFWRNFVVDGSEAQSLIGIGSWSGVDRIRWDITENMLLARRAYGQNPGADDKGDAGQPDGTVVAAYPIEEHFDIRPAYNSSTGETLNVIEENTSDRRWYEREYFRVDWSINLVNTPQWFDMFAGKVFGDITVTPLAFYVNDPNHEDAPHFVPEEGYFDITSKFWVEPPSTASPFIDVSGRIPLCIVLGLFTGTAVQNCEPQEAVIRSSYWRVDQVDPDGDFEPFENSRATLDIVGNPGGLGDAYQAGIVTPPRIEWDPQYGYTDANFRRYMHVHNIWQQSHQTTGSCTSDDECSTGATCLPSGTCSVPCNYDSRIDADANGTDDQCENEDTGYEGAEGSQCSARNRCTIPLRDREIKPIGFWMNKETPLGLTDPLDKDGNVIERGPTEDLVYTWNQALEFSVAKAREVECRRTGDGTRDQCHEQYFEPDEIDMMSFGGWGIEKVKPMDDVVVLCHNPVRDYDPSLCGDVGYVARVGDLRHNFLFYWPYASEVGWGGIANWNGDPLTGQIIGASATTMGRSATMAAALNRDIIMVANGELDMNDIVSGVPAYLYEKELREGRKPRTYTREELSARVGSFDAEHAMQALGPPEIGGTAVDKINYFFDRKKETLAMTGAANPSALEFDALAGKLRGSVYEAQLVDPDWLVDAAAMSPNTPVTEDLLNLVSPLRGYDHASTKDLDQMINLRMEARGICFPEPYGSNVGNQDIQGVAKYFAQKYSNEALMDQFGEELQGASDAELTQKRAEVIYDHLWKETYKGIQLHEMGHALGLLHQFASSYDSTNYNPQYWQLRTHEGRSMESCNGNPREGDTYSADADTCMGPRYLDPETDDELGQADEPRPGINYFASTSTMEYQNERFFENVGLGQYDLFAMNVLYGRLLQTFDEEDRGGLSKADQVPFEARLGTQLADDNLVYWRNPDFAGEPELDAEFIQPMHYTEAAREMRLFDPDRCRDATEEEKAQAEWRIVHGKVCMPAPKDFGAWVDMLDGASDVGWSLPKWKVREDSQCAGGMVRWPYRWGATTNAYPHTNSTDAGADIYEITTETVRKFDYRYPFDYFRRGRRTFQWTGVPSGASRYFFERLRAYHWSIATGNAFYRTLGQGNYDSLAQSDHFWRPFLVAGTEMFDSIARALVMPEPGAYYRAPNFTPLDSTRDLYDPAGSATLEGSPFGLDITEARYIGPSFCGGPSCGGSWDYQNWVNHSGFGTEKGMAAQALTDGRGVFFTVSRQNYLDGRNTNISFRSDMPRALDRLLGGVLSGDWETVAPYVVYDGRQREVEPGLKLMDLAVDVPSRPDGALLLFPNISYRQQLATLVWSHIFSRMSTDLTLANKLRIWVDGLTGELNVPLDEQQRFYNPENGITYIARRYGQEEIDGKLVDKGIGSRMLERANLMLAAAYEVERDEDGNMVLGEFNMPTLILDEDGAPIRTPDPEDDRQDINRFRNYVGTIDAAVQISNVVGYGPFPGGAIPLP